MLLSYYGGPARGVGVKSSTTDMVSDADRAAEAAIVACIRRERPDDSILSEEGAAAEGSSARRWLVDPLDGTTNFLYGYPAWSVSVALEDRSGLLAAVVHDPLRDETCRAQRGRGCELNGRPVHVRESPSLETALVATGFHYVAAIRERQAEVVGRLLPRVRDIRRGGSAAIDLAWLAIGRLDGFYEAGLNPWDWAAGALLVEEAGGAVQALEGDPQTIVAAVPALLPELVALVRER